IELAAVHQLTRDRLRGRIQSRRVDANRLALCGWHHLEDAAVVSTEFLGVSCVGAITFRTTFHQSSLEEWSAPVGALSNNDVNLTLGARGCKLLLYVDVVRIKSQRSVIGPNSVTSAARIRESVTHSAKAKCATDLSAVCIGRQFGRALVSFERLII